MRDWDATSGGTALLDDGTVVALPPDCLRGSVFRFLRLGQRVRLQVEDGLVTGVDLP